jgi:hypothetical protein
MKKIFEIKDTPKLKHNAFLVIFLSLIIIVNAVTAGIFLLNIAGIAERSTTLPLWMVIFSILICVGNVICALATWYWRRWGVIGYGVLTFTAYIVTAISTQNYTNILGLAGSAVLALLVIPYWKSMKSIPWVNISIHKTNQQTDS